MLPDLEATKTLGIGFPYHLILLLQQKSNKELSSFNNLQTNVVVKFGSFLIFRKLLEVLFIVSQQVSLQLNIGVRISSKKFCRYFYWFQKLHQLQVSLHFFAQICRCSVDTELIYMNHSAKNQFNVCFATVAIDFFPFSFLLNSPLSMAPVARNIGWPLSVKLSIMCSATLSQSPSGLQVPYHFFSDPGPRNEQCPRGNMWA